MGADGGLSAVTGALCALTSAHAVDLQSPLIRAGDVANLDCLAPRARAQFSEAVIARVPGSSVALSRAAVIALLRRRIPGLGAELQDPGEGAIVFRVAPLPQATRGEDARCSIANHAIAVGAPVSQRDLSPAPCPANAPRPALAYDAHAGLVRARRDIAQGEELGRTPPLPATAFTRGQALMLVSRVGPVVVERRVRAAQDGEGEASLFVTDEDGATFSAPVTQGQAQ